MKKAFAVDLGASGGKCFSGIFKDNSFEMREVHRFEHEGVPFYVPDRHGNVSERLYWDDVYLYQNIIQGLQIYGRDISDRLDSIGIDTWGADGQFFSPDGDMLGNVYCYRDHRLDDMIEKVKSKIDPERIYSLTGIHFQPFNLSNQLRWFVDNRMDILKPGCFYLPIPSVFYFRLCGARSVDSSWASVTQLMDAKTQEWNVEILDKLNIPPEVLPEIVPPGKVVGELFEPIAELAGINRAKLIAVASHDTASAFAAAPVDNTDEALVISSGTWSLVGKLVPEPITSAEAMAANISNEGGIGNTRFLKNCMGNWITQQLKRVWQIADGKDLSWKELDKLTEAAPAFAAFIDPDDPGFFNPDNMQEAITNFCRKTNQTVPENRGTFLRVVYESLAMKYKAVNEQICRACGNTTRIVHVVGGGCKNSYLNQCTANALGVPVLAGPEEATAAGNFMVQAVGLGVIKSLQEAQPLIRGAFGIQEYKPKDRSLWQDAFKCFTAVCEAADN